MKKPQDEIYNLGSQRGSGLRRGRQVISQVGDTRKPSHKFFLEHSILHIDHGRKVLSLAVLAGGGGVLIATIANVIYASVNKSALPFPAEAFAALIGGSVWLLFLVRWFEVFRKDKHKI